VPTTKAVNGFIIKTTGFSPFFCVENITTRTKPDGVYPKGEAKNSILLRF
jgi:hypothetical protein